MEERLEIFTVKQIRQWLKTGIAERGLSEDIISRTRALAIVNGPCALDDDPVVVTIFVKDQIAAHVATFPEMINGERYWWFPDLWCAPEYRGKGYSLIIIGTIAEMFGSEHCMDKWCAPEALQAFEYLGLKTTYLPRYILGARIDKSTAKGKLVAFVRSVQKCLHRLIDSSVKYEDYTLRYITYIDDATYEYIASHGTEDYILHTQDFFNWVLRYPFTISAPLKERVENIMPFAPAETYDTRMYAVQVLFDGDMIGFYIMKCKEKGLHILYLYYDEKYKDKVFASIRDHFVRMQLGQCHTENEELAKYLRSQIYFPKCSIDNISFVYPPSLSSPLAGHVQYGDGDCFAV